MPPKLRKPTWCFNLAGAPGVCPKVALLFPPTLSPTCSPSCPAGVQHLWPAVPCQLYPHCMWFCPRLRTLPKCPLEGESEIFRGPGEGMSVAWLQAWEANTSFMVGQLLVVPPYSLLLCILVCPKPPVGPRCLLPGPQWAFIPMDSSTQGNRSDCSHSHSLSRCTCWAWAWPSYVPLGALRATDDTCSLPRLWFLPSSHPVLTSIPWGIWSNPASGTFVPWVSLWPPGLRQGLWQSPQAHHPLAGMQGGVPS